MQNDIMKIETSFFQSLGNGVKACNLLAQMVHSVVQSRDTTVLTRAINRAATDKQDEQAARAIRMVAGQVWPKAKIGKAKDGTLSIKIKGIEADQEALARLDSAVERQLSIRHAAFRKAIMPEQEEEQAFDYQKAAAAFVKRHGAANVDKMIAALQAAAKAANTK